MAAGSRKPVSRQTAEGPAVSGRGRPMRDEEQDRRLWEALRAVFPDLDMAEIPHADTVNR